MLVLVVLNAENKEGKLWFCPRSEVRVCVKQVTDRECIVKTEGKFGGWYICNVVDIANYEDVNFVEWGNIQSI